MLLSVLALSAVARASFCDGLDDGYFCDGTTLTQCRNGDVLHTVVCAKGCNETSTHKASCDGTSSCLYGYAGSFCQLYPEENGLYTHQLLVCHRNGLQQQFPCPGECVQYTDSFASCVPDAKCADIDATASWFGFCPAPSHPVHRDELSNFALYDALARELTLELEAQSPLCPFTAYLTACEIVHSGCTQHSVLSRECESSCLRACRSYVQCSEFSGIAPPVNCQTMCGGLPLPMLLLLFFIAALW